IFSPPRPEGHPSCPADPTHICVFSSLSRGSALVYDRAVLVNARDRKLYPLSNVRRVISDTLQILRHHDQVKDLLSVLSLFFFDKVNHLVSYFLKILVDRVVRLHNVTGKLKISVHISCNTVAHHFADLGSHG